MWSRPYVVLVPAEKPTVLSERGGIGSGLGRTSSWNSARRLCNRTRIQTTRCITDYKCKRIRRDESVELPCRLIRMQIWLRRFSVHAFRWLQNLLVRATSNREVQWTNANATSERPRDIGKRNIVNSFVFEAFKLVTIAGLASWSVNNMSKLSPLSASITYCSAEILTVSVIEDHLRYDLTPFVECWKISN